MSAHVVARATAIQRWPESRSADQVRLASDEPFAIAGPRLTLVMGDLRWLRVPGYEAHPILAEQLAYYRARAREYDKWFRRQGLHDLGEELNARWRLELDRVYAALAAFAPRGDVLELAYGTGEWTIRLAESANRVVGVDAAPEMRELARAKLQEAGKRNVELWVDDLFSWQPDRDYDVVFFAFWLSHVPESHAHQFWRGVHDALRPGGRFFFVDAADAVVEGNVVRSSGPPDGDRATELRRLEDGREFRIVERSIDPGRFARDLRAQGLDACLVETGEFFVYGLGRRLGPA